MAELYFSIPLKNHAGLIELRDMLRAKLPASAVFNEPENYHITLTYAEDVTPEQQAVILAREALMLPTFGVVGIELSVWDTPNNYAVVIEVQRSPQLVALQAQLFYGQWLQGVGMSNYSFPGAWRPHVTLATIPKGEASPEYIPLQQWLVAMATQYEASGGEYAVLATYGLVATLPQGHNISEMGETARISEYVATQFSKQYPTVGLMAGIDLPLLTEGDNDPMFVTLKIAEAGSVSANRRYYDDGFITALQEQIITMRPIANQGHIKDEDRATLYPMPAGYWVGVQREGAALWGKAYIPPSSPMREIVRLRKAQKGAINTSIYGLGAQAYDAKLGAYKVENFVLESIDFAPVERSGIPELGGVPYVTREMQEEQPAMDKNDVLKELSAADIGAIPEAVKQAIIAQSEAAKTLAELKAIANGPDLVGFVTTLSAQVSEQKKAAIETALTAEIASRVLPTASVGEGDDDPVKAARALVREMVGQPEAVEAVKGAVEAAIGKPHVAAMLKSIVAAEMGAPLGHNTQRPHQSNGYNPFFDIPKGS